MQLDIMEEYQIPAPLKYCLPCLFIKMNYFIFTGAISRVRGLSEPWNTVFTEGILQSRYFLKFFFCVTCVTISVTISRNWPCFIWSISLVSNKTLDVSMINMSSSQYGSCHFEYAGGIFHLSCKCLIFLLLRRLWSVQISGQ